MDGFFHWEVTNERMMLLAEKWETILQKLKKFKKTSNFEKISYINGHIKLTETKKKQTEANESIWKYLN